jgi:glutathione S-transferase
MLTVHHLGLSQSERIVWLCEELEIPYSMIRYEREPSRAAPPEYKALHPLGTAPIITDGDFSLAESGAIIEYIIGRYGNGRLAVTADKPNFADYLFWLHFANGSMMAGVMMQSVAKSIGGSAEQVEQAGGRINKAFALVEKRLGETLYFSGDELTAADIIHVFALTRMQAFLPRDMTAYPNIAAYLQRIGERPAYQRAMAKAEPGLAA